MLGPCAAVVVAGAGLLLSGEAELADSELAEGSVLCAWNLSLSRAECPSGASAWSTRPGEI